MDEKFSYNHPAYDRANKLYLLINSSPGDAYNVRTLREQYLIDIMDFETVVLNGGISGYMYGPFAGHARQCLAALQAIGATEAHAFLQNACALFPEQMPAPEQTERQRQARQIEGERGNFEERVAGGFEYELWELFFRYWDAHEPTV